MFDIIGTKFGNGDKTSTFNVPDLQDRFLQGANGNLGTVKEAGLPNIVGTFGKVSDSFSDGAFYSNGTQGGWSGGSWPFGIIYFDASRSNSIYGKSDTVQPPAVCVNYIIKAK